VLNDHFRELLPELDTRAAAEDRGEDRRWLRMVRSGAATFWLAQLLGERSTSARAGAFRSFGVASREEYGCGRCGRPGRCGQTEGRQEGFLRRDLVISFAVSGGGVGRASDYYRQRPRRSLRLGLQRSLRRASQFELAVEDVEATMAAITPACTARIASRTAVPARPCSATALARLRAALR
jgi:hypothetical protein